MLRMMWLAAVLGTLALGSPASASVITIDFESFAPGTVVSGPGVFTGITFSGHGGPITVAAAVPGPTLGGVNDAQGNPFTDNDPFRAAFSFPGQNVTSVSVALGDFDGDDDNLFLRAFDSSNNLIGSASGFIPASFFGGQTLTVTAPAGVGIARVEFGSTGAFNNSVYFDNFTIVTAPVPEPTTLAAFGLVAVGGLSYVRRRKLATA